MAGWGNLVNRMATMIAKNLSKVPTPEQPRGVDAELLDAVCNGFTTVGEGIADHDQRTALTEIMRLAGEASAYVAKTELFKLKAPKQHGRLAAALHVLTQAVWDLDTMTSMSLPHSSNAIDRVSGDKGGLVPMPRLEEVEDLDGGDPYPVITSDYSPVRPWAPSEIAPGTPVAKLTPVFTELSEAMVVEELERLGIEA